MLVLHRVLLEVNLNSNVDSQHVKFAMGAQLILKGKAKEKALVFTF